MEVVKSNFVDNLSNITKDIEESAFIAFDGEFTGLSSERNIKPFDTCKEYYEKKRKTSSGFVVIQLGLTFFKVRKDPEGDSEKAFLKSYNIYVYPQSKNAIFQCQGESLSFLASNDFDFNKLFTKGISYCNAAEEEKVRQEITEKQAFRQEQLKQRLSTEEQDMSGRNFIAIPDKEKELIEKARGKIQSILDGKVLQASFEKLNGFQRKLIFELIEREFNNKVSTSSKTLENNQKALVVESKRSKEDELKHEKEMQKKDEELIVETVGLRLLLKEISASKKLIVGHNCLLDLMFLITQCFEDLPESYDEFKLLTHRIFPNIIDTKVIGSSERFKDMFPSTVLNQLHERLTKLPFGKIPFEFENPYQTYSLENPKEHEAGYDSFLTGYCLLVFLKYLNVELSDEFQPNKCKQIEPYLNRIALMMIPNPFIYLTGKEATFSRLHVFFVKFASTWQSSDIQDHFKNYGSVQVSWETNTSAFVMLHDKNNASCVLKTIARPAEFEIQSFVEYQAAQKGRKRDSSLKRKKEESESSESSGPSQSNGSKSTKKEKKKAKRIAKKKMFTECDNW